MYAKVRLATVSSFHPDYLLVVNHQSSAPVLLFLFLPFLGSLGVLLAFDAESSGVF